MTMQEDFLIKASKAARAAGHIFPNYAACEAALESTWGLSRLAVEANNLFGQKQSHPPAGESFDLPTKEYLRGAWVWVSAEWVKFADWDACFAARMDLLRRLGNLYPAYAAALTARDGASFVTLVSKKWSTDPERGLNVMRVWNVHQKLFREESLKA
jgi:flagellum-specific peptidoglycan hydrolase FlgJ